MTFSVYLCLVTRIDNVTYISVPFANFSTLDEERLLFDKQSDILGADPDFLERGFICINVCGLLC